MENSNIRPTGRKGRENLDRMKELMKLTPIKEGVDRSTEVVTKLGPDGKAYAIIKENNQYYIKSSEKTSGLVMEDFKYIGGLMNKSSEAYHSYSEATKQLNMKFINLAESAEDKIFNILRNDNLLSESVENDGTGTKEDKKTSGDNLASGDTDDDFEKDNADGTKDGNTGTHAEKYVMEDVELTEAEAYVDGMSNESIDADFDSSNGDGDESDDYLANKDSAVKDAMKNESISISKAMSMMDEIIDEATGSNEKIDSILESLSTTERQKLADRLKKKA
jgi:hypothetical protein